MSGNEVQLHEAYVRSYDPVSRIATVVMPGQYGMEPIEAPAFSKRSAGTNYLPLNPGDRVLVTKTDNDPPEWISYVNTTGDAMNGTLTVDVPLNQPSIRLYNGSETPYIEFRSHDGTRHGYVQGTASAVRLTGDDTTPIIFRSNSVDAMTIASTSVTIPANVSMLFGSDLRQMLNLYSTSYGIGIQSTAMYFRVDSINSTFRFYQGGVHSDTAGAPGTGGVEAARIQGDGFYVPVTATSASNVVVGNATSSGPRIRMHVPSSGNACYIDYAGWGASGTEMLYFRANVTSVLGLEDTVVRAYKPIYGSSSMRMGTGSVVYGSGTNEHAYIQLFGSATNVDTLGTRSGYIGFPNSNSLYLNQEGSGPIVIYTTNASNIDFYTSANYAGRFDTTGSFLVNKTALDTTTLGVGLWPSGRVYITGNTTNHYCLLVNLTNGLHGDIYCHFRRADVGIGYIYGFNAAGGANACNEIRYNTTSDGLWKGNVSDIDDDWALERLMAWRPRSFQWRNTADGRMSSLAQPSGPVRHGFIAQELYEVSPDAVTQGWGKEEDLWEWLEAKDRGEKVDEMPPFEAMGTDNGVLVPDMIAAMQAMYRRIKRLEEAA